MNSMIGNVILPETTPADWPAMRQAIRARIAGTLGEPDVDAPRQLVAFDEIERYNRFGLTHVRLRYHVIDDEWNEAVCVLPAGGTPAPVVLTIHGTNGATGKYGMLDPEESPNRGYGIELAQRGYLTCSADQFGFGASIAEISQEALIKRFFARYPGWSLIGRRMLEQQRALDMLEAMGLVKDGLDGAIGNSLGGGMAVILAAFDERVRAAVVSTGVSPNATNAFRYVELHRALFPALSDEIARTGIAPWDYHEMLALCAPRALLYLEPFHDFIGGNPDVAVTFACINQAAQVYRLLGAPERIACIIHGDGHDTPSDLRDCAYRWLDRFLR